MATTAVAPECERRVVPAVPESTMLPGTPRGGTVRGGVRRHTAPAGCGWRQGMATGTWASSTRRAWLGRLGAGASLLPGAGWIAACGLGPTAADTTGSGPRKGEPAVVRFAAAGVGTELEIWTEVTRTFNEQGSGVTVQYEPCTAGTASAQDCLPVYFAQYVAGSPPDVWRIDD